MRLQLLERTRGILGEAGFQLSEHPQGRPVAFDLAARREGTLVLVKVFTNADSLSQPLAHELRTLAGILRAAPLLVGERSSAGALEDGVLYFRHRVPLVTPGTLGTYLLDGEPPLIYAAPGGCYVNLDGAVIRALREERGISLGQLAEVAGVSRRTISMYEEGMGALVEVVERLEAFLGEALVRPVELLAAPDPPVPQAFDPAVLREALAREVLAQLHALGYRITPTERSVFNAVGQDQVREDNLILTNVGEMDATIRERARFLASMGHVVEREVVIVVRDRQRKEDVEGTAVIAQDELRRMDESKDVLELIKQRTRPAPDDARA